MKIAYEDIENLKGTESVFELLVECFETLQNEVKNHQRFIFSVRAQRRNNIKLDHFVNEVEKIFRVIDDALYEVKRDRLVRLLEETEISIDTSKDGDEELTIKLVLMFGVLEGINAASIEWEDSKFKRLGPLNSEESSDFLVYLRPKYSAIDDYAFSVGRETRKGFDFYHAFKRFAFFNPQIWQRNKQTAGIPQGMYVQTGVKERKKVRVGVCPCSSAKNFTFDTDADGRTTVSYIGEKTQAKFSLRIKKALETAIKMECDIFILPEYSASTQVKNEIRKVLTETWKQKKKTPYLTISGSTWTSENNNVMEVYDKRGEVLAHYYKYSSYRDADDKTQVIENISCPGKECVFFYLEGIGTIFPSICRDATDGEYTEELAEIYLPLLVVIPAFSPSVSSFETPLQKMAVYHFVSSVLDNYCNARKIGETDLGACVIPQKVKTAAKFDFKPIKRSADCNENCERPCLFICDFDYTYIPGEDDQDDPEKNTLLEVNKIPIDL